MIRRLQLALTLWLCGIVVGAGAATPEEDLKAALSELGQLQEQISTERRPLAAEINGIEQKIRLKKEALRAIDERRARAELGIERLKEQLKAFEDEQQFAGRNLQDYALYFETRLHVSELESFEAPVEEAKEEGLNTMLLETSLDRIDDRLGGNRFGGKALAADGTVTDGVFFQLGPVVWFSSGDDTVVGQARLEANALEPVIAELKGENRLMVAQLVKNGVGSMPLDVSGGKAFQVEETRESLQEHVKKGGLVMVPILGLALGALFVALWKWVEILQMKAAGVAQVHQVVGHVNRGDRDGAMQLASGIRGPVGRMLVVGIEHADRSKELLEELLYEQVVQERPKLERRLPFIQLAAAVAPLLGLLGTVTGMIHTFKMIIVFGTGDAKTLSTGISEALITTEFGLVIAVGALLIHAFLNRQVKKVMASMEHIAISFVNGLSIGREKEKAP